MSDEVKDDFIDLAGAIVKRSDIQWIDLYDDEIAIGHGIFSGPTVLVGRAVTIRLRSGHDLTYSGAIAMEVRAAVRKQLFGEAETEVKS